MKISSESELVKEFIKMYKKNDDVKIITELETNFGRPDIVILKINKNKLITRRKSLYQTRFLRKYSYILSFLFGKGWVSVSTINNFFGLSKSEMMHTLETLMTMGLIDKKDNLVKSKPAKELLVLNRLIVIEAKLSNWKYVIEQAERHLWFSKESSILLPRVSDNIIEKSSFKCRNRGVGLIVFDGKKNRELVKVPNKGVINTPLLWEINEKLVKGEIQFYGEEDIN